MRKVPREAVEKQAYGDFFRWKPELSGIQSRASVYLQAVICGRRKRLMIMILIIIDKGGRKEYNVVCELDMIPSVDKENRVFPCSRRVWLKLQEADGYD